MEGPIDTFDAKSKTAEPNVIETGDAGQEESEQTLINEDLWAENNQTVEVITQEKLSQEYGRLCAFLRQYITHVKNPETNVIDVGSRHPHVIPELYIMTFFTLLEQCRIHGCFLHLTERQERAIKAADAAACAAARQPQSHPLSGIVVDLDIYQRVDYQIVLQEHVESIVSALSKIIRDTTDFSHEGVSSRFRVVVIRKPSIAPATCAGVACFKDGFHFLVPDLWISRGHKRYILKELAKRMPKLMRDVVGLVESPERIVDMMAASIPPHFFGCCKVGSRAYICNGIYEITVDNEDGEINRREIVLDGVGANARAPMHNLAYEFSLSFYVPKYTHNGVLIDAWLTKRAAQHRTEIDIEIRVANDHTHGGVLGDNVLNEINDNVDALTHGNGDAKFVKNLLAILPLEYATNYEKWMNVLRAIAHTSRAFKPLAVWFSQRVPEKWNAQVFDNKWAEIVSVPHAYPVTKRSLMHWARISAPEAYQEAMNQNYTEILRRRVYKHDGDVSHSDIAVVLYAMVSDKFVVDCAPTLKKKDQYKWFEFILPGQNHLKGEVYKWRIESDPDALHTFIADQLTQPFDSIIDDMKTKFDEAAGTPLAKYWSKARTVCKAARKRLGDDRFQSSVVRQSQYRFRKRGFLQELDSYGDIMGVGNGVLKLGRNTELITGMHEYKISKYTTTNYVPYDATNPYVQFIEKLYDDIYPEQDVRDFIKYYQSTGISGEKSANLIVIINGGGSNGKTTTATYSHIAIGSMYSAVLKPALLTSPDGKDADKASPFQMQLKNIRNGYFDEFGPGEVLNMTRVKTIVNPTEQTTRGLFGGAETFTNTTNLMAFTNHELGVPSNEHATWRRIYEYMSKITFCDNPDPNNPYEKKCDKRVLEVFPYDERYKEAMLSVLVHYYEKLQREYDGDLHKVPVPTIARETQEYRAKHDNMDTFIMTMLVKSPSAPDMEPKLLIEKYTAWYKENVSRTRIDDSKVIKDLFQGQSRIANAFVTIKSGAVIVRGYRIKESASDELEAGEAYPDGTKYTINIGYGVGGAPPTGDQTADPFDSLPPVANTAPDNIDDAI